MDIKEIEVKGAKHLKKLYEQIDRKKIELALIALNESFGEYGLRIKEIVLSGDVESGS